MRARLCVHCLLMLPFVWTLVGADSESEQDRARGAMQRGEIRPLVELIPLIEADLQGQLVEIELERRGALWVYEAEVLTADGATLERDYNAATGVALGRAQREEDDDDADDGDED